MLHTPIGCLLSCMNPLRSRVTWPYRCPQTWATGIHINLTFVTSITIHFHFPLCHYGFVALTGQPVSPPVPSQMQGPFRVSHPGTAHEANQPVLPVLEDTPMMLTTVPSSTSGMECQHIPGRPQTAGSLTHWETSYVMTGRNPKGAHDPTTVQSTHVLDVEAALMVLKSTLRRSCRSAVMPNKPDVWQDFLTQAGLVSQYPSIVEGLTHSFCLHVHAPLTPDLHPA